MLAALLISLLGQCDPSGPVFSCPGQNTARGHSSRALAYFEFAPPEGFGMSLPCACTAVTGAKGEAMTFTRASSGTCLKCNTVSNIANGDLVTCSTDQPRVGPGGDGTGSMKLLVEAPSTNLVLRSEAIDNAAWASNNDTVGNPTVTANAAVAPDGLTTAERLQIPATSGSQYSQRYQLLDCGNPGSFSVFVKGNGMSGTLDLCGSGCTSCAFVSASWTRCSRPNAADLGTAVSIGNVSANNGGVSRAANDVFVWGAQCETSKVVTSYIATAGSAVPRAADAASFNVSIASAVASTGSAAATILAPGNTTAGAIILLDHSNGRPLYHANATTKVGVWDGTNDLELSFTTLSQLVANRFSSDWGGSTMNIRNVTDGTSGTDSFDGTMSVGSSLGIGSGSPFTGGNELNGWIGEVCVDPVRTICR